MVDPRQQRGEPDGSSQTPSPVYYRQDCSTSTCHYWYSCTLTTIYTSSSQSSRTGKDNSGTDRIHNAKRVQQPGRECPRRELRNRHARSQLGPSVLLQWWLNCNYDALLLFPIHGGRWQYPTALPTTTPRYSTSGTIQT
jgi:hypothetical protein